MTRISHCSSSSPEHETIDVQDQIIFRCWKEGYPGHFRIAGAIPPSISGGKRLLKLPTISYRDKRLPT